MNTIQRIARTMLIVLVCTALISCEGPVGPEGPPGPPGEPGPAGEQGPPGNANIATFEVVLDQERFVPEENNRWDRATFPAPLITEDVVERGAVLAYFRADSGDGVLRWWPLPLPYINIDYGWILGQVNVDINRPPSGESQVGQWHNHVVRFVVIYPPTD